MRLVPDGDRPLLRTPPQPTLYLHGARDGCIDVALATETPRHLAPGSRMDVIVPHDAEVLVRPGERVRGGITVLARVRCD